MPNSSRTSPLPPQGTGAKTRSPSPIPTGPPRSSPRRQPSVRALHGEHLETESARGTREEFRKTPPWQRPELREGGRAPGGEVCRRSNLEAPPQKIKTKIIRASRRISHAKECAFPTTWPKAMVSRIPPQPISRTVVRPGHGHVLREEIGWVRDPLDGRRHSGCHGSCTYTPALPKRA